MFTMISLIRQKITEKLIVGIHGPFFSIDDLRTVWATDERLERFLKEYVGLTLATDQVEIVREKLLRTISVLVLIDTENDINWIEAVRPWIRKCIKTGTDFDASLHYDTELEHRLPTISENCRKRFRVQRDSFTAVIIREKVDYKLEPGQKLPLKQGSGKLGRGGMSIGYVEKHEVARGHLVLKKQKPTNDLYVARKSLPNGGSVVKNEVSVLQWVRAYAGEYRIATTISILQSTDGFSVLSRCARGDLEKLLTKSVKMENGIQNQDIENIGYNIRECNTMDIVREIKGIAEALEFLHQVLEKGGKYQPPESHILTSGEVDKWQKGEKRTHSHLDIKPQNILIYDGESLASFPIGQWKLTDFGITSFSMMQKRWTVAGPRENNVIRETYTIETHVRQRENRYQPPEINGKEGNDMGRGSDVWSLGCVFAEALAARRGQLGSLRNSMSGHRKNGTFFEYILEYPQRWPKLNGKFEAWLNKELSYPGELQACSKIIRAMMQSNRIGRIKSEKLVKELDSFLALYGASERDGAQSTRIRTGPLPRRWLLRRATASRRATTMHSNH